MISLNPTENIFTSLAVSGSLVTGGATRKYGGLSGTSSTITMKSWTATFRVSIAGLVHAFYFKIPNMTLLDKFFAH